MLHRDDIDMDVIAEFERQIKALHPEVKDFKVVFAGDADLTPEQKAKVQEYQDEMDRRFFAGECQECGKDSGVDVAAWVARNDDSNLGLPEGWHVWHPSGGDGPFALVCPECEHGEEGDLGGGYKIAKIKVRRDIEGNPAGADSDAAAGGGAPGGEEPGPDGGEGGNG